MAERMTFKHNGKIYFDNVMFSKNDALRKLAAYEEIGLSPEEILDLIKERDRLKTVNTAVSGDVEKKKKKFGLFK